MQWLRRILDRWHPLFQQGGRYEKYFVVYEMIDGFLFTPDTVTRSAPHVRDGADLKRVMMYVFVAVTPCIAMAMYNTGYQANTALAQLGLQSIDGWRGSLLSGLGIGYDPSSILACTWHGFLYFFPLYITTLAVGGLWEVLFAAVRNHEVNEGFSGHIHFICPDPASQYSLVASRHWYFIWRGLWERSVSGERERIS